MPKTNGAGTSVITDDLPTGAGASIGLTHASVEMSGSLGQTGTQIKNAGSVDLEAGYFSKAVQSPASPAYQAYSDSITVTWSDAAPANPQGTMYEIQKSLDPAFPLLQTTVIYTQGLVANILGLSPNTGYYVRLRAGYAEGDESAWVSLGIITTPPDTTLPTVNNLQAGDDAWRRANNAAYKVYFSDMGGSHLSHFQVQISTQASGTPVLVPFTNVVDPGSLSPEDSYVTDWSLPPSVFTQLMQGVTNYVTVQVFDTAGNSSTTANAFYVKPDTTAPSIVANVPTALQEAWRKTDPGAIYDVRFYEALSGLDTLQYSASVSPGTADQGVLAWTDIAVGVNALSYTTPWAVNFASLADNSTNYISVRAWSVAGTTTPVLADAFKVFKSTTGPTVAITSPGNAYRSALTSIAGNAASPVPLRGTEFSIFDVSGGTYWDDGTNGFNSGPVKWYPASGAVSWSSASLSVAWGNGYQYRIVARSSDSAGNYSNTYATATFIFDSGPPATGITTPESLSTISSLPSVAGTASDPNLGPGPGPASGLSSVQVRLQRPKDGLWWNFYTETWGSVQVSSGLTGAGNWTFVPPTLLLANLANNTSYTIHAEAMDNAVPPNPSAVSYSTFTFLDNTPPAAAAELSASSTTTPGELLVQWKTPGDDADAGAILLGRYAIGFATFPAANFSTTTAQVMFSTAMVYPGTVQGRVLTTADGLYPGTTYYLEQWTEDDAGNWSSASNQAWARTADMPPNSITGHVVNLSTEGITGVEVNAYNTADSLVSATYTLNDGSGTYALSGLTAGSYKVQASWTVNGITSSVWKDSIPMGSFNVDFVLEINYALASITGSIQSLAIPASDSGKGTYSARAAPSSASGAYVELFQNGRRIAVSGVGSNGRFSLSNLLPGRYSVRAFNGSSFTETISVNLAEGQNYEMAFVWDPLPERSVYAFPNPARNQATIRFETSLAPLEAQIVVLDVAGNPVKEIPGSALTSPKPGLYHAVWDLTNDQGEAVVSGVYLFMVKVKNSSNGQTAKSVKKLAVIR